MKYFHAAKIHAAKRREKCKRALRKLEKKCKTSSVFFPFVK